MVMMMMLLAFIAANGVWRSSFALQRTSRISKLIFFSSVFLFSNCIRVYVIDWNIRYRKWATALALWRRSLATVSHTRKLYFQFLEFSRDEIPICVNCTPLCARHLIQIARNWTFSFARLNAWQLHAHDDTIRRVKVNWLFGVCAVAVAAAEPDLNYTGRFSAAHCARTRVHNLWLPCPQAQLLSTHERTQTHTKEKNDSVQCIHDTQSLITSMDLGYWFSFVFHSLVYCSLARCSATQLHVGRN